MSKRPDVTVEELEEMITLKRMDMGLLSLQLIDVCLLDVAVHGASSVSHWSCGRSFGGL